MTKSPKFSPKKPKTPNPTLKKQKFPKPPQTPKHTPKKNSTPSPSQKFFVCHTDEFCHTERSEVSTKNGEWITKTKFIMDFSPFCKRLKMTNFPKVPTKPTPQKPPNFARQSPKNPRKTPSPTLKNKNPLKIQKQNLKTPINFPKKFTI